MRKADFLAAAGTCKARFGPTPGITEGNFCNSILGRGTFTTECLRVRLLFFVFFFPGRYGRTVLQEIVHCLWTGVCRPDCWFSCPYGRTVLQEMVHGLRTGVWGPNCRFFLVLMVVQSYIWWSTVLELVSVGQTADLWSRWARQCCKGCCTILRPVSVGQANVLWSRGMRQSFKDCSTVLEPVSVGRLMFSGPGWCC